MRYRLLIRGRDKNALLRAFVQGHVFKPKVLGYARRNEATSQIMCALQIQLERFTSFGTRPTVK